MTARPSGGNGTGDDGAGRLPAPGGARVGGPVAPGQGTPTIPAAAGGRPGGPGFG